MMPVDYSPSGADERDRYNIAYISHNVEVLTSDSAFDTIPLLILCYQ